jgi:hypothetical protein
MSPGTPPGISGLVNCDSGLSIYTIRALRVNNELGLLVDLIAGAEIKRQRVMEKPAVQPVKGNNTLALSAEEAAYFADLD